MITERTSANFLDALAVGTRALVGTLSRLTLATCQTPETIINAHLHHIQQQQQQQL